MANALERVVRVKASEPADEPHQPTAAETLAGVRQDVSNALLAKFDEVCADINPTMGEMTWAVAMMQARILASAEFGEMQTWAASQFGRMVAIALPAFMMEVEKRKRAGKPPNDA